MSEELNTKLPRPNRKVAPPKVAKPEEPPLVHVGDPNTQRADAGSAPSDSATWEGALDAGAEAPPAVDSAQLEAVAQSVEAPAVAPSAPASAPAPAAAPQSGLTGDVSPAPPPGLWSKRKISKTKASDLRRYVTELQARVPPPPGEESADAPSAPLTVAEKAANLHAALAGSFPMAGRALSRLFQSDALLISKAESDELAEAWAPLALPYYDEIVQQLPWAIALGKTYEIGEPKVQRMLEERAAKRAAAPGTAAPAGDDSGL